MDAWQRLLDGEAEEWRLLLREEFGDTEMTYSTFIGPDGHTPISYKHDIDTCECDECETARWQRIEREQTRSKAQAAIASECRIAREQAALQAAWDELQAVPSYIEREARIYNERDE